MSRAQALPDPAAVGYPSFKLILVGDGGTGEPPTLLLFFDLLLLRCLDRRLHPGVLINQPVFALQGRRRS
jgi:hypothetical protein